MRPLMPVLLLALAACAADPAARRSTTPMPSTEVLQTTFMIVRHAEKSTADPRDPPLDEAGRRRAAHLSELLDTLPVSAVYATPTRRARQTAAPTAQRHRLPVADYDPARPASELATVLHTRHAGGTVLVVGHSNTVPGIVAALCACTVAPLDEDDYGDLFEVRIGAGGDATLALRAY